MKKYSDKALAANLIQIKMIGYPLWKYIQAYLVKYLCCIVPVSILFWLIKIDTPFFTLLFGIFIGALARDLGWSIYSKKTWPFQEKVIDWQKVKELAEINNNTNNQEVI